MLAMVTVLGRRLALPEFGVYGLFVSISAYVLIVQLSIEGATVRAIAAARTETERAMTFTTALWLYALAGVVSGGLILLLGFTLAGVLGIPDHLRDDARTGVLALAVLTALGWPAKVMQDLLRGSQLFGAAALAEMLAYALVSGLVITLALVDAPLAAVIAVGGALPSTIGLCCLAVARGFRVRTPFDRHAGNRRTARGLSSVSAYLLASGIADFVVYSLDRVMLAAFKGPAAVGLYEGAVRPQNLLRQLLGTLVLTVSPVASDLRAAEDEWRPRELMVRGTRYVLAIVAPVAITIAVLAEPLLAVWLGDRYRGAAGALAILAASWTLAANTGVASGMLLSAGRARVLAANAWLAAVGNVALVLALTPALGLEGIALAIAIPPVLLMPRIVRITAREYQVSISALARKAWLPAYSSCAMLAAALLAVRALLEPDSLLEVFVAALGGLAGIAAVYWVIWLDAGERALIRSFLPRR